MGNIKVRNRIQALPTECRQREDQCRIVVLACKASTAVIFQFVELYFQKRHQLVVFGKLLFTGRNLIGTLLGPTDSIAPTYRIRLRTLDPNSPTEFCLKTLLKVTCGPSAAISPPDASPCVQSQPFRRQL
mgnify:CR=1 FL=1